MEVPFDFSTCWNSGASNIQRMDQPALLRFNPRRYWAVEKAIDKIGQLSSEAQGLKKVITSYDKIVDCDEEQIIYIMWEPHQHNSTVSVINGMLKIGKKHLYLLDEKQQQYEVTPICVLDFFIHPSKQRHGYGNALFDFMLVSEVVQPYEIAYDRPSEQLLKFLEKNYTLEHPVWQNTNFVVFPQFFEDKLAKITDDKFAEQHHRIRDRKNISLCTTPSPRRSCPNSSRRDSAAAIIHGDTPQEVRPVYGEDTPQGRKNTRDFGHTHLW